MKDYQKYINALRKCAKEHENDRLFTGHVIVSDLCRDTANLLETIEQKNRLYNKAIDDLLKDANEMAIEVDTGTYTMKSIGIGLLEQIAAQLKMERKRGMRNESNYSL